MECVRGRRALSVLVAEVLFHEAMLSIFSFVVVIQETKAVVGGDEERFGLGC